MLDPTEAPEGCVAVKAVNGEGCSPCLCLVKGICKQQDSNVSCLSAVRKDKTLVTFKKKETPNDPRT